MRAKEGKADYNYMCAGGHGDGEDLKRFGSCVLWGLATVKTGREGGRELSLPNFPLSSLADAFIFPFGLRPRSANSSAFIHDTEEWRTHASGRLTCQSVGQLQAALLQRIPFLLRCFFWLKKTDREKGSE